jgi:8-oxo-dGTP diphosphatase
LAFDHAEILAMAGARLKGKVRYEPIGFELLPRKGCSSHS